MSAESAPETVAPQPPPPKRQIPATAIVWIIAAINVGIFALAELAGGTNSRAVLVAFGAKFNPLIANGEYWRLLTAAFLHIGTAHLILNMVSLMSMGRMVEMIFGHARFLAIYIISALLGSLLSYLFSWNLSAGASGAVFGVAGALIVFFFRHRKVPVVNAGGELAGFIFILLINGAYGLLQSNIDNFAHFGGLLGGIIVGRALCPTITVDYGEDGQPIAIHKEMPGPGSWAIVPALFLLIVGAVLLIPGATRPR